ncbi:MAG TPA: UDP-N-acetylmuramoyl-L-alanyl-D-glutamate--2,6-diaminopimelate ligase [Fimbriimonadaceae bacterium]|nr:UDP-N-acetylmuramoyl-L-alanyl-D-glutamate--2,6-diaminopimelate ligase [Fimbriimonadaceae bacterium]
MRLSDLVNASGASIADASGDAEVLRPIADSRLVRPGDLFFCMPSARTDTHALIESAAAAGATAAVLNSRAGVDHALIPYILPAGGELGFREAIWRLAHTLLDHPSRKLKVLGVTGTNGKTTTAWILRDLLSACGTPAAYLGTLGYKDEAGDVAVGNTTPFAVELVNIIADANARGAKALAMEVSSHALAERRADGTEFDAAVFTNLTQDHLDFHGTMEQYADAKWRLFSDLPAQSEKAFTAAINIDDPIGAEWAARSSRPVIRYSLESSNRAFLTAEPVKVGLEEIEVRFNWRGEQTGVATVQLGGGYNVSNTLSAVAGMLALGYSMESVVAALPKVRPVPGRFEPVPNGLGIGIIVDYAHTPDALIKLLDAVRALQPKRVITVFGCGGDRDGTKRPIMAKAASERSDLTVVTSDNPRTEDPAAILSEVQAGVVPGAESVSILDRVEAVAYAVRHAQPGDAVVIAGKGHEDYQIIGHTKHPMDDRELARRAIEACA